MKRANRVTVSAPASVANLGAGYDVFALALRGPSDELTLRRAEGGAEISVSGLRIDVSGGRNVVAGVAGAIIDGERVRGGVKLGLRKGVPVGKGLGSSAASSAAAAFGMNVLYNLGLDRKQLVEYAGVGERIASGTAHFDNVAAAIAGGFVLVSKEHEVISLKPPAELALCLVTPTVDLPLQKTRYARSLVPKKLPVAEVVETVSSAGMMVHGFSTGNLEEIGKGMEGGFVDSRRAVMIPGYKKVVRSAMDSGAAGVCISGAGPTLLAVTGVETARFVLKAMRGAFRSEGVLSSGFVTSAGEGCKTLDRA